MVRLLCYLSGRVYVLRREERVVLKGTFLLINLKGREESLGKGGPALGEDKVR